MSFQPPQQTRFRLRRIAVLAVFAAAAAGCSNAPQAPELRDSPVYSNSQEGFRFRVPDEWTQTASTVLPPGPIEGDVFLVRYLVKSAEPNAMLTIVCSNDVSPAEVAGKHAGPSFSVVAWKEREPLKELSISGQAADRIVYEAKLTGRSTHKHVTCFHHAGRLYSFVALYASNDEKARQQVERAVESVRWD